jgi:23S rRNA pseudouridine2605 synthase
MTKVKKALISKKTGRVPLHRALSKLGKASREEAKVLILSGKIKVHGSVETNPDRMVNPDRAHIEISGEKAEKESPRLILFHKPAGFLTTKRDPEGRPTIYDLLPDEFRSFHPVGRLDQHTSGLLLLTNNTRLSNFLTDPENQISRCYIVQVRGQLDKSDWSKMQSGVVESGETLKCSEVHLIKESKKESTYKVILKEGKYREIRRLFEFFGCEVSKLKRIEFGALTLGELKVGQVHEVENTVVDSMMKQVYGNMNK